MGKRKTPVFRQGKDQNTTPKDNGKVKAIRTWDDVEHDSEDDFHDDRNKVLLNDAVEENEEESDREIYGLEGIDSDQEESDQEEGDADESPFEEKTWGTAKQAYYDADEGDDLDEMKEEETEALRIQKEQLANLDEADFVDDALASWGQDNKVDVDADKKLVEVVSKDLEDISFGDLKIEKRRKNLPIAEKIKILQNESPELLDLLDEFKEKANVVKALESIVQTIKQKNRENHTTARFLLFKYEALMNYMANVSFYFALKASESIDVRAHPVIQALFNLRQTLEKIDSLEQTLNIEEFVKSLHKEEVQVDTKTKELPPKVNAYTEESDMSDEDALSMDKEDTENEDDIIDRVQDIEEEFKSLKKLSKKRKRMASADDFGELDALDELDMEDKLTKKKSIRDYVAKIDSKQLKNTNKYQGDVDLPYRDRVKQERKGVVQPADASADLDDADWDEEDTAAADVVRNGEADSDNEYYNKIKSDKESLKRAKKDQYEADRAPIETRDIEVEEGQKRLASYKILKNKGLTPHRKKENRNARVKHRNKYAKKMKRLSSTRAVVKAQTSGYGGEMSGVKTNVIKSVKLSQ